MSALSLETSTINLKSAVLTILELLAFNAQKCRRSRAPVTPPFRKIVRGHVWNVPGNTHIKFEDHSFNRFAASNLTCMFPGTIQTRLLKFFSKRGHGQGM